MSTQITLKALKPCPLCNSENVFDSPTIDEKPMFFVYCDSCGVYTDDFTNRSIAIEHWNRDFRR